MEHADALALSGLRVNYSPLLWDGDTILMPDARLLIVGTRQRSWAHREALRIVRHGLADVLLWLGEPVDRATSATFRALLGGGS